MLFSRILIYLPFCAETSWPLIMGTIELEGLTPPFIICLYSILCNSWNREDVLNALLISNIANRNRVTIAHYNIIRLLGSQQVVKLVFVTCYLLACTQVNKPHIATIGGKIILFLIIVHVNVVKLVIMLGSFYFLLVMETNPSSKVFTFAPTFVSGFGIRVL